MSEHKKICNLNRFFIVLFFGIIAFLQIDLLPAEYEEELNSEWLGVNAATIVLLFFTTVLVYTTIPKAHLIRKAFNLFKKNKWTDDNVPLTSESIDVIFSKMIYYMFFWLLVGITLTSFFVI